MEPLQIKAQMMPATRRADGSVTLKLVSAEEVETDLFAHIDNYRQQTGWLLFRPNQFNESDIPDEDAKVEGHSPSKTQRMALYKLFLLQGGRKERFPQFYQEQMATFLRVIGDKIEALEGQHGGQ